MLTIGCVTQYKDLTDSLHFSDYFYRIKFKTIEYPLNYFNDRKYSIKVNLVSWFCLSHLFPMTLMLGLAFNMTTMAIAYFDSVNNFHLIMGVFWLLTHSLAILQSFGILWIGFVVWFALAVYLEMKLTEVNQKLQYSIEKTNKFLVFHKILKAIEEHKFLSKMTHNFNDYAKWMTMIIYFIATPGFIIVLKLINQDKTTILAKLFCIQVFFINFSSVVMMNLMSTWINRAALKPHNLLCAYILRTNTRISMNKKLKILAFVEHLKDANIGFYCYDFFAINLFKLIEYLYYCGSLYLLISSFFR